MRKKTCNNIITQPVTAPDKQGCAMYFFSGSWQLPYKHFVAAKDYQQTKFAK